MANAFSFHCRFYRPATTPIVCTKLIVVVLPQCKLSKEKRVPAGISGTGKSNININGYVVCSMCVHTSHWPLLFRLSKRLHNFKIYTTVNQLHIDQFGIDFVFYSLRSSSIVNRSKKLLLWQFSSQWIAWKIKSNTFATEVGKRHKKNCTKNRSVAHNSNNNNEKKTEEKPTTIIEKK